jgi:class 3 adenylate cyclase
MGVEDEVERSLPRPCRQTNGRSKRTCELTSSVVPRGTSFHRSVDLEAVGPAVNEVARIETLCEPQGRRVLVSAELAAASGNRIPLEPLGAHLLREVREPKEIFALRF